MFVQLSLFCNLCMSLNLYILLPPLHLFSKLASCTYSVSDHLVDYVFCSSVLFQVPHRRPISHLSWDVWGLCGIIVTQLDLLYQHNPDWNEIEIQGIHSKSTVPFFLVKTVLLHTYYESKCAYARPTMVIGFIIWKIWAPLVIETCWMLNNAYLSVCQCRDYGVSRWCKEKFRKKI